MVAPEDVSSVSEARNESLRRDTTLWVRGRSAGLRDFLTTETGSAGVLVAAAVAALVWANLGTSSYLTVWHTELSFSLGDRSISRDLQEWINSGLMTLFFLVVGLEARREFDLGELRDRRRFLLPFVAGIVGMIIPVGIYLTVNYLADSHGGDGAHGWGVAMSTDTALALGLLSMLGRNVPERVRIFLLTVFVVDDLAALLVIALVYSDHVTITPLFFAAGIFALVIVANVYRVRYRSVYALLGIALWAALEASGVDPVVAGLLIGLSASAYTPNRTELDAATGAVREFREQPTPELARSATTSLTATLSPNDRLQHFFHPWTSYLIVPLFALANVGIVITGPFLAHAFTAPITLGVLIGYVVGKPVAVVGTSWVITRLSHRRIRPPVGWGAVVGSGTIAGIGFTVSLLIATRAFTGEHLAEAKLGALSAAVVASALTWTVYRVIALFPLVRKARLLLGDVDELTDLIPDVDEEHDHIRGPADATVTIVEYGDFECPYCGQAEPILTEVLQRTRVRYVWRHLPLTDVHPRAQLAAEAAEAAAAQGAFWPMHDLLLSRQENLKIGDLVRYAQELGLDHERFHDDLFQHTHVGRIAQDVDSADLSGVSGTPTFFLNGRRHYGAYDVATLTAAVRTASIRAKITAQ